MPVEQAIWVTRPRYGAVDQALIRDAWNSEALAVYRWFADLPAFDGMSADRHASGSSTCAFHPGAERMPSAGALPQPGRRGVALAIS